MNISSRIKPRHLELVLKIAETEQLQLAAKAVAISQPAASRILSELEASVGSSLFVRHPLGMELTPAGQVFVRHARVMMSELETLESELEQLQTGASGSVRVGAVTGPAVGYLMPALQSVLKLSPNLHVSVDVSPSSLLFQGLEEGRYDFVLARSIGGRDKSDYLFHPGRSEIVSFVVHQSHPLAGKEHVSLETLREFPWVIQEEGSPIRNAVENTFHENGVAAPDRVLNSSSLLVALAQIAEGQAIATQTKEVKDLLVSEAIGANLTEVKPLIPIAVAPYFVIQGKRRKLSRASEHVLEELLRRM